MSSLAQSRVGNPQPAFAPRAAGLTRQRARGDAGPWLLGLAALVAVRLAVAASIPLTEDEAYYRLWAQHPAWGYYDHPPMVAWALWAGVRLFGDTPLGARSAALAASAATTLLVAALARRSGLGIKTARRAALWYAAAPLIGFGGVLIVPDVFASLFWAACLWALLKAREDPRAWLAAGAAAGLAFQAKYSAVFLGPAILWWLRRGPDGRARLRTPWPWLGLATAMALAAPNLAWNAGHGWATFVKQFGRAAPRDFAPLHLATFILAFAALFNLLALPFLARAARRGVLAAEPQALDLLWISGAPFLGYLLVHSLHASVQAHWPAPTYAALATLAAAGAQGAGGGWRTLARAAPVFGLAASTVALAYLAAPATGWLGRRDPANAVRGWPGFARRIEAQRRATGARWVGMLNYGDAALLAAQWRGPAPALQVTERRRYGFAPAPRGVEGPGLVVDLPRRMATARLSDCFAVVRPLAPIWRRNGSGEPVVPYAAAWVDAAKRDVARQGCRTFHDGRADP